MAQPKPTTTPAPIAKKETPKPKVEAIVLPKADESNNVKAGKKNKKNKSKNDDKVNEFLNRVEEKKRKNSKDGSVSVKGLSVPKETDQKEKLYFFLSACILLLTCVIIIAAIFGFLYTIYRVVHGKREKYFQFDQEAPRMNFKTQLEAIQEEAGHETDDDKHKRQLSSDLTSSSKQENAKGKFIIIWYM